VFIVGGQRGPQFVGIRRGASAGRSDSSSHCLPTGDPTVRSVQHTCPEAGGTVVVFTDVAYPPSGARLPECPCTEA
jgi:hypothetical protein